MHTNETQIYNAILIACGCIALIIFYFVFTLIRQQRRYRNFQISRVSAEIDQLETDRKNLADELHDEFGPRLFGARMKFASMELVTERDRLLQQQALLQIDELINRLRKFTAELMPSVLFGKGLLPAIREFFDSINSSDLELSFHATEVPVFDHRTTIHIYKILHEIVFNTIKHSGATTLVIELYVVKNKFAISTADDGVGFDYKGLVNYGKGQGLKNIINRVDLISGDLQVSSHKNKGTSYFISVPIK